MTVVEVVGFFVFYISDKETFVREHRIDEFASVQELHAAFVGFGNRLDYIAGVEENVHINIAKVITVEGDKSE